MNEYTDVNFDFIITVCDNANENCPYFPSTAKRFHHNFTDPAKAVGTEEEIAQQFREVRETIKGYCKNFIDLNKKEFLVFLPLIVGTLILGLLPDIILTSMHMSVNKLIEFIYF